MGAARGIAGPRPEDITAAAAFDKALAQITLLKGADAAKVDAYEASLLTVAARMVDEIDAYIAQQGVGNVSRQLLAERNVMAAALIDKDVYYDSSIQEILPQAVQRQQVIDRNGVGESGYFGAMYSDDLTKKLFISNRGTELGIDDRFNADAQANVLQGLGMKSMQYSQAMDWAQSLMDTYGRSRLIFTGHSLGGGLASAQAEVVAGSHGIIFNAAGLHSETIAPYGARLGGNGNIQAYYVRGEALSAGQDRQWVSPAALGPGLGSVMTYMRVMPQADGTRITLEPVSSPHWSTQTTSFPFSQRQVYHDNGPLSAGIQDAMDLHGQSQVVFALLPRFSTATASYIEKR